MFFQHSPILETRQNFDVTSKILIYLNCERISVKNPNPLKNILTKVPTTLLFLGVVPRPREPSQGIALR